MPVIRYMSNAAIHPAIDKGLSLLTSKMDSKEARVILLAIGFQESRLEPVPSPEEDEESSK